MSAVVLMELCPNAFEIIARSTFCWCRGGLDREDQGGCIGLPRLVPSEEFPPLCSCERGAFFKGEAFACH